ncbi:MAG: hypothetical protein MSS65_07260 [Clostridium sp.]|nr:hypothetical protein [Clostridium sp.]
MDVKFEQDSIEKISKEIGGIEYKAKRIFQQAVNRTMTKAVEYEREAVRKRYVISAGGEIDLWKQIRKKSATYSNPVGQIISSSTMNRMSSFLVTPRRLAHGAGRPAAYRGKVLRDSPTEQVKGFMVRFRSGREEFVHRVDGKKYETPKLLAERLAKKLDPTKIEPLYSPATPFMAAKGWAGDDSEVQKKTAELLEKNIRKQIDRFLKARDS